MIVNPFSETMDMAQVYSLNETAAWLWKQLENKEFTVDEAGNLMKTRHHEVDAQKRVKRDEKLSQHGEKERSLVLHHAF